MTEEKEDMLFTVLNSILETIQEINKTLLYTQEESNCIKINPDSKLKIKLNEWLQNSKKLDR
jgi:hypothetical protein